MKVRMLNKGLAIAVIILFVGVGIQPAYAINSDASEIDDDCNLCLKVNKQFVFKIKSLICKIEVNRNKLSKLSKYNPDIEEKFTKISSRFSFLKQFSENYVLYWNFPFICSYLFVVQLSLILFQFLFLFNKDFPISDFMIEIIDVLGFKLGCPWYIHPPTSL